MTEPVTLSPESVEAIADALAKRLGADQEEPAALLSAREVEQRTGLSYYQVRQRREELGCVSKPGAPMLFSAERVAAFMRGESVTPGAKPVPPTQPRPPRRGPAGGDLLPVKR